MTKFFPSSSLQKPISETEKDILSFWKRNNIFQKTIDTRPKKKEFVFFDGPPFATGLPHYGHILAGTLKDAIPRYFTMKGFRVERRFGWDCHGVPVEFLVEKENKIGGKPGIEKMGVSKFNELCRSVVLRCRDDWEDTVERMGRFVDFKNDYKTMDPEFMESVWWVFKKLWDKGLIYEGQKVVSYSPKLGSPLSNFEAGLNYKDIDDPAVTVKFELEDEPNTYVLAWTTTPWTLPINLGLCVNPKMDYVKVRHENNIFIIAKKLVEQIFEKEKEIIKEIKGKDLIGKKYKPLFPFFKSHKNAFQILGDDFVGEEEGTGIVHMAPAGEDDARILTANNIELIYPFDDNCFFDSTIPELEGKYFRPDAEVQGSKENNANDWVLENLGEKLFDRKQVRHSYPHCWRTDCALMYRGINTWFVNVQKIKNELLQQNQNINWIPSHLKDGRFGKGLENAPDWAISRNRFWGAPLPVWRCDKCGEIKVIGSKEELENLCGQKIEDLHKHFVDKLTWKCQNCDSGKMKRIEEVLDCWFESGSMPYAAQHYPFSNKEFQPADFIAEGLDQTRGWFYTLHVLGVALFGKNVFKNVITNGIVLAEDGEKMSKSKQNFPNPNLIFEKYGADAMRFYLLNSPVARGENLRFSEHGVEEVLKSVILPLKSSYQFFSTYANIDNWTPTRVVFVRHGHAESNEKKIYSGKQENNHHLTEKGKKQAKEVVKILPKFDIMYASPFVRTKETAEIIKSELDYEKEIILDDRLRELFFGELEGKKCMTPRERMKNKTCETKESCTKRITEFFADICKKHKGKTVCAVSHGGTIRHLETNLLGITDLEEFLQIPHASNTGIRIFFAKPNVNNELDSWILSELQTTIKEFRKNFDAFLLEAALRTIPKFVDNLNNWYLRRSRRRFWASGMSEDKESAYETLHYVLITLAKILAPVCPFFSDKMYQDLTGGESVHLEIFPFPLEKWINKDAEKKVAISREIVGLAAGIRARKKIKLRQPLQKLQFKTTEKIDLDLNLLREEANVKEVEILDSLEGIAQKIVRVNAKKVGPRLGGKVQELIKKGKNGDFEELTEGKVKIADEILEQEEYEIGFICEDGLEAESTKKTVVLLDTDLTEELEIEGLSREITRTIQELRKNKEFEVSNRIKISYQTESNKIKRAFKQFKEVISKEVLAQEIKESALSEKPILIDGESVILRIEKSE